MLRPNIYQVAPQDDFTVLVFFDDGSTKSFDAKPLIAKGGIFSKLEDVSFFKTRCSVLNHTLAWDVTGRLDPTECIDVCPDVIYESGIDVNPAV
ncbi:MAG: DUF2442 domain-containing protein [Oscillospiraceae bacterium]|jgi:hypothetical protein|nr:DUF2442 domain-containing protein [Oscillospiraceae bacterium]